MGQAAPPGHHAGRSGAPPAEGGTMSWSWPMMPSAAVVSGPWPEIHSGHSPRVQTRVRIRPSDASVSDSTAAPVWRDWTIPGGITVILAVAARVTLALASPILSSPCEDDHDQNPRKAVRPARQQRERPAARADRFPVRLSWLPGHGAAGPAAGDRVLLPRRGRPRLPGLYRRGLAGPGAAGRACRAVARRLLREPALGEPGLGRVDRTDRANPARGPGALQRAARGVRGHLHPE